MASNYPLEAFDGLLDVLSLAVVVHACAGEPTSVAGVTALSLANGARAPGNFTKTGTVAAGRVLTVQALSGLLATAAGTADHVAYVDTTNGRFWTVPTTAAEVIGAIGDPVNISSHTVTVAKV